MQYLAFAGMVLLIMPSCQKEKEQEKEMGSNPLSNYSLIDSEISNNKQVELYFTEDPFVGFNQLALRITDISTDQPISDISISMQPMMEMGMMRHSSPFSNPEFDSSLEAYLGDCTFIMPSGQMGSWSLSLFLDQEGIKDTLVFNLNVVAKSETKVLSFESEIDSSKVFIALRAPSAPKIGANSFELMVYERASMMSFPPLENLSIEIVPEMPTMGHGSPNNVNPVYIKDGHYVGEVNFTMSGYWKVHLSVKDSLGQVLSADQSFDITFQ